MARSNYYYDQWKYYDKQVTGYDKNIQELTRIKNILMGDFYNKQNNVNRELGKLRENLNKSVRHDLRFSQSANECELHREKSTTADVNLNRAVIALENEVALLNGKKIRSQQSRDLQYQNYKNAKQKEYQAYLDSLNNLL